MKTAKLVIPLILTLASLGNSTGALQAAGNPSAKPDTEIIYQKALDKLHNLQTFKTVIHSFNKGYLYHMKPVATPRIGIAVFNVVFQRPRRMYFKIVKSQDSPDVDNTQLYFDGGPYVKIKVPGILGLFTFTFAKDKAELTNFRGYTTEQIDTVSLERRLSNKDAKVKLSGEAKVFDEPVYLLDVSNIEMLDKISREVVGVRKSDNAIVLHEMYEGNDLVCQDKFRNFQPNVPVTEQDFKL